MFEDHFPSGVLAYETGDVFVQQLARYDDSSSNVKKKQPRGVKRTQWSKGCRSPTYGSYTWSCRISIPVAFFAQGEMEGWLLVNGTTELQQLVHACSMCTLKALKVPTKIRSLCYKSVFEGITSRNCMAKSIWRKAMKSNHF